MEPIANVNLHRWYLADCWLIRYKKNVETGEIALDEVGPRFELRPFQITLGTIDQKEAEVEWVLRPYMNTAKKRQVL